MGALDGIIQLLLFVCFGVYVAMGIGLIGMGAWYMSDVGALGATAMWLLLFGFLMLIIGGVAIFANLKQIWLVLFVVELINVVLFLSLYTAIVVVIMMASGSSDPIRKASKEAWVEVKPTLTIEGSASEGGDGALSDKTYCESDVVGSSACTTFYKSMFTLASSAAGCHIGDDKQTTQGGGTTITMALNNCTSMKDWNKCSGLYSSCAACETACYEQTIADIKEQIIPASYFVLFLVAYFLIVIFWNNIMIGADDLEGVTKLIGLAVNGVLLLLSLILVGVGTYGYSSMECPKSSPDCEPMSLVIMILLGLATLGLSGLVVAGIQLNNNILLRVGTLVMCFVLIFLLLAAIILGMSSGVVMDDMNHYYDTQYPKLRQALERAENSYCRMTKEQCTALTLSGTAADVKDKDKVKVVGSTSITKAMVWKMQFNEAALESSKDARPNWLANCDTTGICIYCDEFQKSTQKDVIRNKFNNESLAPNVNFQAAINGIQCKSNANATVKAVNVYTQYTPSLHWNGGVATASTYLGQAGTCDAGWYAKPKPFKYVASLTGDDENTVMLSYGHKDNKDEPGNKASKQVPSAWQAMISNHSRFKVVKEGGSTVNDASLFVGKCALAILNHVAMERMCPEDADTKTQTLKFIKVPPNTDTKISDTYVGDCEACKETATSSGFSLIVGGGSEPNADDSKCLNYFAGHLKRECSSGSKCVDMFDKSKDTSSIKAAANIKFMVDKAFAAGSTSKFCNYPDLQCKQKIQDQIEASMSNIAIFGVIFCLFFMAIIFFTLQAIHIYKGGDDDDDDDDDDE
jgi:hypothetical protein